MKMAVLMLVVLLLACTSGNSDYEYDGILIDQNSGTYQYVYSPSKGYRWEGGTVWYPSLAELYDAARAQ